MKKSAILFSALSFLILGSRPADPQVGNQYLDFVTLLIDSKKSQNGLEAADYRNVCLKVEIQGKDENLLGLNAEEVRRICETRLQRAGFRAAGERQTGEYLLIALHSLSTSFSLSGEFRRPVVFAAGKTPLTVKTGTWRRAIFGSHGQKPDFMVNAVEGLLDSFLKEYLEANAP